MCTESITIFLQHQLVVLSPPHSVSLLHCHSIWPGGAVAVVSPFWTPVPTLRAVACSSGWDGGCVSHCCGFGAVVSLEPKLKNPSLHK